MESTHVALASNHSLARDRRASIDVLPISSADSTAALQKRVEILEGSPDLLRRIDNEEELLTLINLHKTALASTEGWLEYNDDHNHDSGLKQV